jgi:plasmid maintenance system antidote protein VapI
MLVNERKPATVGAEFLVPMQLSQGVLAEAMGVAR